MKKTKVMVTGQTNDDKDLGEILTGKRESKFSKFPTRKSYQEFIGRLGHIEICEELLRLNSYPSTDKRACVERCLAVYDRAHAPKKVLPASVNKSGRLEDLVK